jgi:hypothetical protein
LVAIGADFPGGFAPQPAIQVIRGRLQAPTVVGDGHSRFFPAVGYSGWQTQKVRDLPPALERDKFLFQFGHERFSYGFSDARWYSGLQVVTIYNTGDGKSLASLADR